MKESNLRFQVDSRLATLLSQEYSSTEKALKELIDNAWDADAEQVTISLPRPMSKDPIVVADNGSGMTEEELRRHYLVIASDRRKRRGEQTAGKHRQIKGRKGIGKFAGLMVATTMTLETRARGRLCGFTLRLQDLALVEDIEHLELEVLSIEPTTLEASMHKAIEHNLWIFGPAYSLFSSNITLKRQVEDYLGEKYSGTKADKRPDLLLNQNLDGEYLLIEFKRPNHPLDYADYQQATAYRHEFKKYTDSQIRILMIGGRRSTDFPNQDREPDVHIMLFDQVISAARRQIEWMLRTRD